jgi:GT2 family glycosyltransferase
MTTNSDVTLAVIADHRAENLADTLTSIQCNTSYPHRLLLIDDGCYTEPNPDPRLIGKDRVLRNPYRRGFAACANHLLTNSETPYIAILRGGVHVTPGWLSRLIQTLKADPRHGIAGPSTSFAWNEQQVVEQPDWTAADIEAYARTLHARHGDKTEYLDELHSIGDFCYSFKRELVARIGYFDEGYGRGPCAEIDYNTRAARAGYKCVWVRGAYVHRFSRAAAAIAEEESLVESSKRRYQEKYCGLKLGLEGCCARRFEHCLGEACRYFAPRSLIEDLTFPMPAPPAGPTVKPLVSCIMPTCNRGIYANQAIRFFSEQDYPERELIIVDDGNEWIAGDVPTVPNVRVIKLARRASIGEKRNIAVRESRGEFIVHWDDDDWYGRSRISYQLAPLLADDADITGLDTPFVYDLRRNQFWLIDEKLHARMMVLDVTGGTLAYCKAFWQSVAGYPEISLAEDAAFLQSMVRAGARLLRLPNRGLYVYVRHGTNTWAFDCGTYRDPRGWRKLPSPDFIPPADIAFYASLRQAGLVGV